MSRKLIIPKIKPSGAKIIQEGFCGDKQVDCKGLSCKNCIYHESNLKHFIIFFELESIHGEINVTE